MYIHLPFFVFYVTLIVKNVTFFWCVVPDEASLMKPQVKDKKMSHIAENRGSYFPTNMIMKLFELWDLTTEEQLELLGKDRHARANLTRYRQPGATFGSNRDLLERVGHLLAIHKSLRIIFPHNRELVYLWPKAANHHFGYKTPIAIMQEYGYTGLLMIRTYLDRERGL